MIIRIILVVVGLSIGSAQGECIGAVIGGVIGFGVGLFFKKKAPTKHYLGADAVGCDRCGMMSKPNSKMRCSCGGRLGYGGAAAKALLRK